jgi:hypothetical protein
MNIDAKFNKKIFTKNTITLKNYDLVGLIPGVHRWNLGTEDNINHGNKLQGEKSLNQFYR